MIAEAFERARAHVQTRLARSAAEAFTPRPGVPFPAGAHPLDWRRSGLDAFGKKVCRSFLEALLADESPAGLVGPGEETLGRVIKTMDLWLGSGSKDLSRAFLVLCGALEVVPVVLLKRPARFTALSLEDRLRVLEALEDHDNGLFSMLLTAFKVPLATAAFEQDELLASTGFPRPDLIAPRKIVRS